MKTRIIDYLNPEDEAMLQALYSRSAESVDVHVEKVRQVGPGKFMSQYYVGYGHKSIADCGTTTMFIEDVSLLAAKAIQDWPLYSGQETSTRYIDMAKRQIIDPFETSASKAILDAWMTFYMEKQEQVRDVVRERYPMRDDEKPETYERAVKARAFDILRGFLPAGVTTQLSWHANLRQAGDHLAWLVHHPTPEISCLALALRNQLGSCYPSSGFGLSLASGVDNRDRDAHDLRQDWEERVSKEFTYSVKSSLRGDKSNLRGNNILCSVYGGRLMAELSFEHRYTQMLATRPRGCVLPHFMSDLGQYNFEFLLDFGSFRDLQRHRNGVVRMPLLDTDYGFESWYLDQLGPEGSKLRTEAVELTFEQHGRILALPNDPVRRQYYVALGYRVHCQVTFALPALVYFLELRSGKTVHPTLRQRVHAIVREFKKSNPDIALHADTDPDDWDVRRGDQTITTKQ